MGVLVSTIGPAAGDGPSGAAGIAPPDEGSLSIRTAFEGGTFVIALYGELDIASAEEAEQELRRAEASSANELVIDLGGLRFIDSTGIRLVFGAHARAQDSGTALSLLPGPPSVQRTFEVCGLVETLPFAG